MSALEAAIIGSLKQEELTKGMFGMLKKIMKILEDLRPDIDFNEEKGLIDDGVFDSFDIVTLVGELNDVFDIGIRVEDLVPENFNSVEDISRLVESLLDE